MTNLTYRPVLGGAYPAGSIKSTLVHAVDENGNAICGQVKSESLTDDSSVFEEEATCKRCRKKAAALKVIDNLIDDIKNKRYQEAIMVHKIFETYEDFEKWLDTYERAGGCDSDNIKIDVEGYKYVTPYEALIGQ